MNLQREKVVIFLSLLFLLGAFYLVVNKDLFSATTHTSLSPSLGVPIEEIPSDFVTYTDDNNLFSISFPSDWTIDKSKLNDFQEDSLEVLKCMKSGTALEESKTVFFGGYPDTANEYLPSLQIVIGSTKGFAMEKLAEDAIQMLDVFFKDFVLFEKSNAVIGEHETIIFDYAYTVPEMGRVRLINVFTVTGTITWNVRCGTSEEYFETENQTIRNVMNSFQLLF